MTIQTLNNYVLRKPVMRISLLLFSIVALAFILRPAQLSALAIAAEPDRSIVQAAEEKTNSTAENVETKADVETDKKKAQQEEEEKRLQKINDENYALYELLIDTIDQVEEYYVKPIDKKELIQAAIDGVLRKLDPHSVYIPDDAVDEFKTDIEHESICIHILYNSTCKSNVIFHVSKPSHLFIVFISGFGLFFIQTFNIMQASYILFLPVYRIKGYQVNVINLTLMFAMLSIYWLEKSIMIAVWHNLGGIKQPFFMTKAYDVLVGILATRFPLRARRMFPVCRVPTDSCYLFHFI